jgi:hypothetical protein
LQELNRRRCLHHLTQLLQSVPSHGTVFQLQLLLPLLEERFLVPETLFGPLDRVPLQVDPVPEKLQLGAALELLSVGKRVPQMIRISLRILRELILQILQFLELSPQIFHWRARPLIPARFRVVIDPRSRRTFQTGKYLFPAATRIRAVVRRIVLFIALIFAFIADGSVQVLDYELAGRAVFGFQFGGVAGPGGFAQWGV